MSNVGQEIVRLHEGEKGVFGRVGKTATMKLGCAGGIRVFGGESVEQVFVEGFRKDIFAMEMGEWIVFNYRVAQLVDNVFGDIHDLDESNEGQEGNGGKSNKGVFATKFHD